MNSRVESKYRETDDARETLVRLTAGAGFRMLVKQALDPGEPLQIDIGDGSLLVLAHYRLPVELGHSFGAEGMHDDRRGIDDSSRRETMISLDEASVDGRQVEADRGSLQVASISDSSSAKSLTKDRRRFALAGIAAAIALSAAGLLWGGIHGERVLAWLPVLATPVAAKAAVRTVATNSVEALAVGPRAPQSSGFVGPTLPSVPLKKPGDGGSKAISVSTPVSKAPPVSTSARAMVPSETASAPPVRLLKATFDSGPGPAHSISISASDTTWVTACADGIKVFGKVFNKGDSGEVRFSSRATVHSANAGAIELKLGDQAIGVMGRWGQVQNISATPAGYEYVATATAGNCSGTSPVN